MSHLHPVRLRLSLTSGFKAPRQDEYLPQTTPAQPPARKELWVYGVLA